MNTQRLKALATPPSVAVSDGTLEALKWLAVALMTGDHINKYLLNGTWASLFDAGRLTLPLFAFVLACNLARPGVLERGAGRRTVGRLALFGAAASVPFIALGGLLGGWWPLNILWTLAVAVSVIALVAAERKWLAFGVLLLGGSSVEFWWPAILLVLGFWLYQRRPAWSALVLIVVSCAALRVINGNWWAVAALPILWIACRFDLRVPRLRWFFYAYYPLHLTAIWIGREYLKTRGYLFF